jgi:hypothetical protein
MPRSALQDQARRRSVREQAPPMIGDPSFGCPDAAAADPTFIVAGVVRLRRVRSSGDHFRV